MHIRLVMNWFPPVYAQESDVDLKKKTKTKVERNPLRTWTGVNLK